MKKYYFALFLAILLSSCATYQSKYVEGAVKEDALTTKNVAHTVYLIGDAGLSPDNDLNPPLKVFKNALAKADQNSTAIFLGDNIYPAGLPDKKDSTRVYRAAKNHLDAQLKTLEDF